MFGKDEQEDAYTLFREAALEKKNGNIEHAIELLFRAKEIARSEDVHYTIEDYLRLPNYLQQAGRTDEAWKEYNSLILNGYPNQLKKDGLDYHDLSSIYNKMRLHLQREGKNKYAIEFGVLSFACEVQARIIQKSVSMFSDTVTQETVYHLINVENIVKMLRPLLAKAKLIDNNNSLAKNIRSHLVDTETISMSELLNTVRISVKAISKSSTENNK